MESLQINDQQQTSSIQEQQSIPPDLNISVDKVIPRLPALFIKPKINYSFSKVAETDPSTTQIEYESNSSSASNVCHITDERDNNNDINHKQPLKVVIYMNTPSRN